MDDDPRPKQHRMDVDPNATPMDRSEESVGPEVVVLPDLPQTRRTGNASGSQAQGPVEFNESELLPDPDLEEAPPIGPSGIPGDLRGTGLAPEDVGLHQTGDTVRPCRGSSRVP